MNTVLLKKIANPSWAVQKAYYWGGGYLNLGKKDIIMAFYPKTGSTWVRIFLYNLLSGNDPNKSYSFDDINEIMPAYGHQSLLKKWPFPHSPVLVKTHKPYNMLFGRHRSILFCREPKDVMLSFSHYARAKNGMDFEGTPMELIKHPVMGLENYMNFYNSWLPKAGLVLKYEELRKDPVPNFRKLVDYVGLKYTDTDIQQALDASSLQKTREAQKNTKGETKKFFKEGFVFARSGQTGEGQEFFDKDMLDFYHQIREKYNFNLYPA